MTLHSWFEEKDLFYWHRDKKGSQAEVDYLWQYNTNIIPIEVKADTTGTLKSMHLFMKENNSILGVRFSYRHHNIDNNLLSIPFWAIEGFQDLIMEIATP